MAPHTDHTRAEELFSAYLDQRTSADERLFVERHLAACAECRAKYSATRAMVTALRQLPPVKAPRSFVLPKEYARQAKPARSILNWYPALRMATVFAVLAFVVVFAGDLLTARPSGVPSVTMAAVTAPEATPMLLSKSVVPAEPPAAAAEAYALPTATADAMNMAGAAMASGSAAVTDTVELTPTQESMALAQIVPEITPEPAADAPALDAAPAEAANPIAPAAPAADPLRLATWVLGGLAVLLGVATLIARRAGA